MKQKVSILSLGVLVLGLTMLFTGCERDTLYSESENLASTAWLSSDTFQVSFEITEIERYHTVHLESRFTDIYPYSNIYYRVQLNGPGGQDITEVKNFEVTDKTGKWLGSGFGDLHSYSFPIIKDIEFKQKGKYKVKVIPFMRVDSLPGIHDRGIRVSIGKEVF